MMTFPWNVYARVPSGLYVLSDLISSGLSVFWYMKDLFRNLKPFFVEP